ncbi:MAG: FkbM family methyltransferase [Chromatiales bacterium]|nr:FkbM family methyltransferase [Gammaproteobacteria bacterium]MCP5352162.1 FkbM family methyltransferase [Chromatiales bacterium]
MWARWSVWRGQELHWLQFELSKRLGVRLWVNARLGNGMKVAIPWNDTAGRAIYSQGWFEPETVQLFERLFRPGWTFLDIGAHIGQYSLLAAPLLGPQGRVHAFEPDPDTFAALQANVRRNGLDTVSAHQLALSDQKGELTFYRADVSNIGGNSLMPPLKDSGERITVQCETLDDFLDAHGVGRVDIVKADIEGFELAMFTAGERVFAGRPFIIFECNEYAQKMAGSSCRSLGEFIGAHDYDLYLAEAMPLPPYRDGMCDKASFNILAVPRERIESMPELFTGGVLQQSRDAE